MENSSKKTAFIISIVIGGVVLSLFILITLISCRVFKYYAPVSGNLESDKDKKYEEESSEEYYNPYSKESSSEIENQPVSVELEYVHDIVDTTTWNDKKSKQDPTDTYYSGPYNYIIKDLTYQIGFQKESCYVSSNSNIGIEIEYPQIVGGDVMNKSDINDALAYEYSYYENFLKEHASQLTGKNDELVIYADAYVTYMDEQLLSVIYYEEMIKTIGTDTNLVVSMNCLNFDLLNGELYDNTQLLNMDEAFAIDFRQREVNENGSTTLAAYTDREIQEMLNNPVYLVVFFSPMGMEVGLNIDDVVYFVTYKDYNNYLK